MQARSHPYSPAPRNSTLNTTGGRVHSRFRPKFNLREFGVDDRYTIDEFVSVMDDYVRSCDQSTEAEICAVVKSYLKGVAATIVLDARVKSWENIRKVLMDHYRPEDEDRTHLAMLTHMHRSKGEAPASLAVRIRTSTNKAYPDWSLAQMDKQMLQTFLTAMDDPQLQTLVLASNERTFKGVVDLASRLHTTTTNPVKHY